MHITIFGATGKIGRHVVTDLLAAGHDVTAYVRNPAKLPIDDSRLRIVTGELSDGESISGSVRGADAVISALGPTLKPGARGTPLATGTANIVAAMSTAGVRRYIGLATPSVADPRDRPTLKAKILPVVAKAMFPNALTELTAMTKLVTDSKLDWTIARITNPTDTAAKGTRRVGFLGRDNVGWAMSRADIAAFLVDQLTDTTYTKAAPAISN